MAGGDDPARNHRGFGLWNDVVGGPTRGETHGLRLHALWALRRRLEFGAL